MYYITYLEGSRIINQIAYLYQLAYAEARSNVIDWLLDQCLDRLFETVSEKLPDWKRASGGSGVWVPK